MKTIIYMLAILTTIAVAACGGGGATGNGGGGGAASASSVGVFSDAPVSGLTYKAQPSGTTGTTNSLGQFNYAKGDSVTFSAAGITLGTASNLPTTSTAGNPSVITPINLVSGATGVSNPTVTAIGQFLGGLNSVAVASGEGEGGVFNIPVASGVQATTISTMLRSIQSSGTTASTLAVAMSGGGAIATAIASASGVVPTTTDAQANIAQGANSNGVVGSMWIAPCPVCGTNAYITLYFNTDGTVWGFGAISSASSGSLVGTWQASLTLPGNASFEVVNSPGSNSSLVFDGVYMTGTLSVTSSTAQIYDASNTAQGSAMTLSPIAIPTGTNTAYDGVWTMFIDATTAAGYNTGSVAGSSATFVFEPNGNFYMAPGSVVGQFNQSTGVASGPSSSNPPPATCGGTPVPITETRTVNLATGSVSWTDSSGSVLMVGHIARAGLTAEVLGRFFDNALTLAEAATEQEIPLSLNVNISWPANTSSATASLVLGVVMTGPMNVGTTCTTSTTTKLEAYGARPEINPLGNGAAASSTTDTFSVGYIKGQAASYQVSVLGPSARYCSVTQNGSGSVVDANSGNASAYPTVNVVCTQ